jgi:hypothetical protein
MVKLLGLAQGYKKRIEEVALCRQVVGVVMI